MSLSDAMSQTSLQLKRGLGEFGYTDHYAVLGLSVDAAASDIRKRYLKLAKRLHPDSCPDPTQREQASRLLSKLVNPGYQVLSQEKERRDYQILLKLVGQRANSEYQPENTKSEFARSLLTADDFEQQYQTAVQSLAKDQYQDLSVTVDAIEQLSELNLILLMRREASPAPPPREPSPPPSAPSPSSTQNSSPSTPSAPAPQPTPAPQPAGAGDYVAKYLARAEQYVTKGLFNDAVKELREGLRLSPDDPRCHAMMGTVYLRQKKTTMAKVHLKKALKVEPNNPVALKAMRDVSKLEEKLNKTRPATVKSQERKGLFGLFGGKK